MEKNNKLDVAAKLFPAVTTKRNSSVFRISAVMKEKIDSHFLQIAVNIIRERYSLFFVRMRRGVFWNYFENNHSHLLVEKESDSPCETILSFENRGYLIKVLYFNNRISVEAFHSITDGSGVVEFLNSLIYYYICSKFGTIDHQGKVLLFNEKKINNEDSFKKHFADAKKDKKTNRLKEANSFRIKGKRYKYKGNSVVSGIISVAELKSMSKKHSCSITAFLLAVMIKAIFDEKQSKLKNNKPIVIAVPVNLRKMFSSSTLKNFFGVVNVGYKMTANTDFAELIKSVTDQLKLTSDMNYLESVSAKNVKISENVFSVFTPLVFKNVFMPIGFEFMGEIKKSISMSNIGRIDMADEMKTYVEYIELLTYPTVKSPINCGICSFEDKLCITFTRAIKDVEVIRSFFTSISKEIEVSVYSNDWGERREKM